jgi:hypothetical protein
MNQRFSSLAFRIASTLSAGNLIWRMVQGRNRWRAAFFDAPFFAFRSSVRWAAGCTLAPSRGAK